MNTFRRIKAFILFISYSKINDHCLVSDKANRYSSSTENFYQERIQIRKGNISWSIVYFQKESVVITECIFVCATRFVNLYSSRIYTDVAIHFLFSIINVT